MSSRHDVKERGRRSAGEDARERLLSGLPVTERRLQLAGVATAVLEGGDAHRSCCCRVSSRPCGCG
jgi:hypothetical protein